MKAEFTTIGCTKDGSMFTELAFLNVSIDGAELRVNGVTADVKYLRTLDFLGKIPVVGRLTRTATDKMKQTIIDTCLLRKIVCLSDRQDMAPIRLWARNDNWLNKGKKIMSHVNSETLFEGSIRCFEANKRISSIEPELVKDLASDLFNYDNIGDLCICEVRATLALLIYMQDTLGFDLENVIPAIRGCYNDEAGIGFMFDKKGLAVI